MNPESSEDGRAVSQSEERRRAREKRVATGNLGDEGKGVPEIGFHAGSSIDAGSNQRQKETRAEQSVTRKQRSSSGNRRHASEADRERETRDESRVHAIKRACSVSRREREREREGENGCQGRGCEGESGEKESMEQGGSKSVRGG